MIGKAYYNYVTKIRLYSAKRAGGGEARTFRHPYIKRLLIEMELDRKM
jgi:hypothetical protein